MGHVSRFRRPPPHAFAPSRETVRSRVVRVTRPYPVVQERGSGRRAGNGNGGKIGKVFRFRAFYHTYVSRARKKLKVGIDYKLLLALIQLAAEMPRGRRIGGFQSFNLKVTEHYVCYVRQHVQLDTPEFVNGPVLCIIINVQSSVPRPRSRLRLPLE